MIMLILILFVLTVFTYLLFIGALNIIYYVVSLIVMICFLVLKIKISDGKKDKNNKEQNKMLKKLFPKCRPSSFSNYIFLNYKNILELMNKEENEELEKVVTNNIYKEHIKNCEYFKEEHYKNIISDIELVNVEIKDITNNSIVVEIDYKCIDYTLNRKNKVIRGEESIKKEYGYLVKYIKKDDKILLCRNDLIYQK